MAEGRRGLSVRARTTLGAVAVVAVALSAGSLVFARLVEDALVANVVATAERDAEAVADLVEDSGALRLPEIDDAIQQLVDASGTIVAVSEDSDDVVLPAVDRPTRASLDGDSYIVVVEEVEIGEDHHEIRLALPLDDALDSAATVGGLLLVAVPILLIVLAGVVWLILGRALRPVETLRREVDAIGPGELDHRVVEPPVDDEIGRLARTMNRMLARLDDAARAQRRFVSDASHELRSPLASLRQNAEVARSYPEQLGGAELADVVLVEGERLQGLVDDLLLLARLDEGGGLARHDPVDLDDLVLDEAGRLRARGTSVDTTGIGPARVDGDARMLARAIRNLTDNAARHARESVRVSLVADGDGVVLVVDDDGPGIPVADRASIFERFVRLDDGRARDAGGSGLGLAIVAEVARAHSGNIVVEEAPTGGARFVLRLPRSR